jgi:amino acid transporter
MQDWFRTPVWATVFQVVASIIVSVLILALGEDATGAKVTYVSVLLGAGSGLVGIIWVVRIIFKTKLYCWGGE